MPSDRTISLIGVDCATDPRKVGLALATWDDGVVLRDARVEPSWDAIRGRVAGWITPRTILALDAPLGWPTALGRTLSEHVAGGGVEAPANALFRRSTDDVVREQVGKRPLDVGADRIARTAHRALAFLNALRAETGLPIPLAWTPGEAMGATALEVYPAATLAVRGVVSAGYKGDTGEERRLEILDALGAVMRFDEELAARMRGSDHVLDAALCCLAAGDFMDGRVLVPADAEVARKEGWIWVREPGAS